MMSNRRDDGSGFIKRACDPMDNALISLIEAAFSMAEPRAIGPISVETYDDEGTQAHFMKTKWGEHFLKASIIEPGKADVIPRSVVFHLERAWQRRDERWAVFSADERGAIAKWIAWYRDQVYPHDHRMAKQRRERSELSALAEAWWHG
mgnify:CR=1 FL=1